MAASHSKVLLVVLSTLWWGVFMALFLGPMYYVLSLFIGTDGFIGGMMPVYLSLASHWYHIYKLPKGWQAYYTVWGGWRNRSLRIPAADMAAAWPLMKAELRNLRFDGITKQSDTRVLLSNSKSVWQFSHTVLAMEPDGDHVLCTCNRLPKNKVLRLLFALGPVQDAGSGMRVLQALERGWQLAGGQKA
jgi:hypothetical protein